MVPANLNPLDYMVSNPTTTALMALLKNVVLDSKPSAAGLKTVHIGQSMLPNSILDMVPTTTPTWKKGTYMYSLSNGMRR